MRKLHLVGVTDDQKGLIFSGRRGSRSGGYVVPIEDGLIDAIADARRAADGGGSPQLDEITASHDEEQRRRARPISGLTPREIQARLRAGRTIAEVAAEAQVGSEWVERFAIPILAEQNQVVEHARTLKYSKPRLGESSEPLDKSVGQNLADRGVRLPDDVFDAAWSAYQLHDSVWAVRFRYRSRGRLQEAVWELDAEADVLTSRNRLASELGYVERSRRRRRAKDQGPTGADSEDEVEPLAASRRAPRKAAAKRAPAGARRPAAKKAAKAAARPRKAAARSASAAKKRPATTRKSTGAAARPARARPGAGRRLGNAARTTSGVTSRVTRMSVAPSPPAVAAPSAQNISARAASPAAARPADATPAAGIAPVAEPAPLPVADTVAAGHKMPAPAVTGDIDIESLLEPAPPPAPPVEVDGADDVDAPLLVRRVRAKRAVISAPAVSDAPHDDVDAPAPPPDTKPPALRIRRPLRLGPAPAS